MRHAGWMIDQRFYTAQTFGQGKDMGGRKQLFGCLDTIVFQCKAHHATETPHLLAGDAVARMIGEPTPIDLADFGVFAQKMSDSLSVETMPIHSYMQGLYTAQNQKTILRTRNRATAFLNEIKFFPQFIAVHHQTAVDHVAMTTEIFGRGMQNDVGAEIERVL